MIAPFGDKVPALDASVYVAPSAIVIGDVAIGPDASVWFHTVVRADVERIRIGARSNVQDNSTVHVVGGRWPVIVGDDVTVGHAVVLHGCTVGNHALIGMGAIVLDGAEIGDECLVGAGAVVTPGTHVAPRGLVLGSPGRRVRDITGDEIARLHRSAASYVEHAQRYRALGFV